MHGDRHWLWVMANPEVAYFQIHPTRSKAAFIQLIADWSGILVSDGYLVYQSWQGLRQSCLAHLIRTAKDWLSTSTQGLLALVNACTASCIGCVIWIRSGLRLDSGEHGMRVSVRWSPNTLPERTKPGTYARRLAREGESLWMFLDVPGVEATNNIAERAHRFGVLWRKRSQGTCSEKGNRWVERLLSLRHTCRIRGRPTFPLLVDAVACLFKGAMPDLRWLTQHEALPVPSTP